MCLFFFFQAEDGIRDKLVTGVQTCALPISPRWPSSPRPSTLPSREERMTEIGREEIVWRPTREYAERTRLARFMRSLGVGSLEELQRRSIAEPDWYWDAVVRDLGLRFSRPYTRVRDVSRGVQWPRWFEGGLMNFADNCVDRHVDAGRGEQPALIWEEIGRASCRER